MKYIIKLFIPLFLLLLSFNSCDHDKDYPIVTDVQPGVYVSGSATSYSSIAPASSFKVGPVDPDTDDRGGVTTLYTWLKSDGDLFITKSDDNGNITTFGKGETVSNITSGLVADGPAFKVSESGLYFLIYNSNLNQLSIIPAKFGIIGAATAGGWDAETLFTEVTFDEAAASVQFKGTFALTKDEMKFRYGDWGIEVPYDASSVIKYHTNVGATGAGVSLSTTSSVDLKSGGENLAVPVAAAYELTLKYDLKTSRFSITAKQGEIIEPEYPEELYMIGAQFGDWNWESDEIVQMVPVNGAEGAFWAVKYIEANKGFKWAPQRAWSGGDFAQKGEMIGYTLSDGNAVVAADGLYIIYIDMKAEKIAIEEAKIYGMGDAFGGWNADQYPFTITGDKATITTTAANNLRMYASSSIGPSPAGDNWWRMEFNIFDGKIVYRGTGGDQAAVPVQAGQTVTLNFRNDTGTIE